VPKVLHAGHKESEPGQALPDAAECLYPMALKGREITHAALIICGRYLP
jgi:hypothetical protein